jgi:hypothetical protein
MRWSCAIAAIAATALLCASPAAVAGATSPAAAPALYSQVAQLNQVAELLGRRSSRFGPRRGPSFSVLRFENHDGYVISVIASRQTVALRVARHYGRNQRPRPALSTTYLAHGKATPTSIEASFGDRGRISLRFRPLGRGLRATKEAGCKRVGGFPIARRGFFVGELRFRGEDGYTSARTHRVRGGSFSLAALLVCLLGGGPPGGNALLPSATLPIDLRPFGIGPRRYDARPNTPGVQTQPSHRPKPTILFSNYKLPLARAIFAAQARGMGRARFLAFETSSEGSIGIARIALASARESAFSSNDFLSKASVAPPAPFSGRGAFEHGPGSSKSWAGSLAVSFLGEPHLPLAGPPFEAQLIRGW